MSGVKWGLDLSRFSIVFFPDALQGWDVWGLIAGLFKDRFNFRGIVPPQIYLPQMNLDLPIDDLVKQILDTNICEPAGGAAKGILELVEDNLRGQDKDAKVNVKIVAQGVGGNAVLDAITRDFTNNTTNQKAMQDISSVAIYGAFLGSGGYDENSMKILIEAQKVAQQISIGMALIGALQMLNNPGFAQYLIQGSIGYLKTWAEGMIKTWAYNSISEFLLTTLQNNQGLISELCSKLPGGVQFPGYNGKEFNASEIQSNLSPEKIKGLFNRTFGCSEPPAVEVWDLSKLNWDDIVSIAGSIARYIENYDGAKNDLIEGSNWLGDFTNRSFTTIKANLDKLEGLRIKAAEGSDKAPLTVSESAIALISQILNLLHYVPEPITNAISNIGPIVVSILNTTQGNGFFSLENMLGDNNPFIQDMKKELKKKAKEEAKKSLDEVTKAIKPNEFPIIKDLGIPIPVPSLDFMPFIGDLIDELINSLSFGKGTQAAPNIILQDIDEPGEIGIFYPYKPNDPLVPFPNYNGWLTGVTTDKAIIHVMGWASDFLPQFLQIYAQADNGPVVTTVLKLDTTLMTTADGKRGKADWELDVPLPHAGKNVVKVWSVNAGGHRVETSFIAYLVGTSFPREGSRAIPVSSYIWRVYDTGLFSSGSVIGEGGGIINFLDAKPGDVPLSELYVRPELAGKEIRIFYPDNTPNPDLLLADENGNLLSNNTVPQGGKFRLRLKGKYTGKSFVTIMGAADALKFKNYAMEYKPRTVTADAWTGIIFSDKPAAGPLFQFITAWDVWSKRLTGAYTLRTLITDENLNYTNEEKDRCNFTIGTPIDIENTAPTIVSDPYFKFQLTVPAGAVKQTEYVNVYSENTDLNPVLMSPLYDSITSKYGIYPELKSDKLNTAPDKLMILTIKYTDEDLDLNGRMDEIFGLNPADADYNYQKEKAKRIIEENLGIYREFSIFNSQLSITETARELIKGTQHPIGTYSVMTRVAEAYGKYYVLPADKPPILRYPPYASPFIFNPEEEAKGRTITSIYFSPMAATSKYVYADIKIWTNESNPAARTMVRHLYNGIDRKEPIELRYAGKFGDVDEYRGNKYWFYNFVTSTADPYMFTNVLNAPLNGIAWDGMGNTNGGYGYVGDGVYRAVITLMDVFGNTTSNFCYIVKGRIVPEINQIAGKYAQDGMTLNVDADGTTVVVKGLATGGEAYRGYRLGYRSSDYVVSDPVGNPDEGYNYIELPREYAGGAVTTTVYNLQINRDKLAVWDISALESGKYDLALFILGEVEEQLPDGVTQTVIKVVDRAIIKEIEITNPPGIHNVKAEPNPFSTGVTITANINVYGSDVQFIIKDINDNQITTLVPENPAGIKYVSYLDGDGLQDGYYKVSVVAGEYYSEILIRKITGNSHITANITSPVSNSNLSVDFSIQGNAYVNDSAGQTIPVKMSYYEIYAQVDNGNWELIRKSGFEVRDGIFVDKKISEIKGDYLNLKLIVYDTAGNSANIEVKNIYIDYITILKVEPEIILRDNNDYTVISYYINKDMDDVILWVENRYGGILNTYPITDQDKIAGLHKFEWTGKNIYGFNYLADEYFAKVKFKRGSNFEKILSAKISLTEPEIITGITVTADGEPKPYFDFAVSGSGKYDKPLPVSYTVTGYAAEQWMDEHKERVYINVTTEDVNGDFKQDFIDIPYNQTFAYNADGAGCGNDDHNWEIWINGILIDQGHLGAIDTRYRLVNRGDHIRLYAWARKEWCWQTSTTSVEGIYKQINSSPTFSKSSGFINKNNILYYHRENVEPFAVTIPAKHTSDWNAAPQHGSIIDYLWNKNVPDNVTSYPGSSNVSDAIIPEVTYNPPIFDSIITGLGGNINFDGRYFSQTDTVCNTCTPQGIPTGLTKTSGIQLGTLSTYLSKTVTVKYSSTVTADYILNTTTIKNIVINSFDEYVEIFTFSEDTEIRFTSNVNISQILNGLNPQIEEFNTNLNQWIEKDFDENDSSNSLSYNCHKNVKYRVKFKKTNKYDNKEYTIIWSKYVDINKFNSYTKYVYLESPYNYTGQYITETVIPLEKFDNNNQAQIKLFAQFFGFYSLYSNTAYVYIINNSGQTVYQYDIHNNYSAIYNLTLYKDNAPYKLKIVKNNGLGQIKTFVSYLTLENVIVDIRSNTQFTYTAFDSMCVTSNSYVTISGDALRQFEVLNTKYYLLEQGKTYNIKAQSSGRITLPFRLQYNITREFNKIKETKYYFDKYGTVKEINDSIDFEELSNGQIKSYSINLESKSNDFVDINILSVSPGNNKLNFTAKIIVNEPIKPWNMSTITSKNNYVTFSQGEEFGAKQTINIFKDLRDDYGNGFKTPFPDDAEANSIFAYTGMKIEGPSYIPHSSTWTVQGPYYPDTQQIHDDILLGKGNTITSPQNNYTITFSSADVSSDGFQNGLTYDEYDIDKINLLLKPPSFDPYESKTYAKIMGVIDVPNFNYYTLEYKKSGAGEQDSYHLLGKYYEVKKNTVIVPVKYILVADNRALYVRFIPDAGTTIEASFDEATKIFSATLYGNYMFYGKFVSIGSGKYLDYYIADTKGTTVVSSQLEMCVGGCEKSTNVNYNVPHSEPVIFGYLPVKDKIGKYDILLTVVTKDNKAYKTQTTARIGHYISAEYGGAATDAYEQVFLQFPPNALRQGNDKLIKITPLKRRELPLLENNLIPSALIYDFKCADPETSKGTRLRKDDFKLTANGNVIKPAILTMLYDDRQLGGFPEGSLSLYKLEETDTGEQELKLVPAYIDTEQNIITAELTSFSTVQLIPDETPPDFEFYASPDPAGRGSSVSILVIPNKTLKNNLNGYVYLPAYMAKQNQNITLDFVRQEKEYLTGLGISTKMCNYSNAISDNKRVILGYVTDNNKTSFPADGKSNTSVIGTQISIDNKNYYIYSSGIYNENGKNKYFVILSSNNSLTNIIDVRSLSLTSTSTWQWKTKSGTVKNMSADEIQCEEERFVLKTTQPGEVFAAPNASWFNNKRIRIGNNDYYIIDTQKTGNELIGFTLSCRLIQGTNTLTSYSQFDGANWTIYAPINKYRATFDVSQYVVNGVTGVADVYFSGIDLLGNTGSGKGSFKIDTTGIYVTLDVDKTIAKKDDIIIIKAKSYIEGQLPQLQIINTQNNTLIPIDNTKISASVIPETDIQTGEIIYNFKVDNNLSNFEGDILISASVSVAAGDTDTATKTVRIDTRPPGFILTTLPAIQPRGIGKFNLIINTTEPLRETPAVSVNCDSKEEKINATYYAANEYWAEIEVKPQYIDSSMTIKVSGYDFTGNSGEAYKIEAIDTIPPDKIENLQGRRLTTTATPANHLIWVYAGNDEYIDGFIILRDNVFITKTANVQREYFDILNTEQAGKVFTYYVAAVDYAGNTGPGAYVTINPENSPPVTSLEVIGNCFNANIDYPPINILYLGKTSLLKLIAQDTSGIYDIPSGILNTYFAIDNSNLFNVYSAPFNIDFNDTTGTVYYYSVDRNGNSENVKAQIIYKDTKPPKVIIEPVPPFVKSSGWQISNIPESVTTWPRDQIIAKITSTVETIPAELLNILEDEELIEILNMVYHSQTNYDGLDTKDRAYLIAAITNTSKDYTVTELEIKTENELRMILREIINRDKGVDIYYFKTTMGKIKISVSDKDLNDFCGSGIKSVSYRIDNSNEKINNRMTQGICETLMFPYENLSDGIHNIEAIAEDMVGNRGMYSGAGQGFMMFIIDTTAPSTNALVFNSTSLTITADYSSITFTSDNVHVALFGYDNGLLPSGLDKTYYKINNSAPFVYETPIVLNSGEYNIEYYSVDKVENIEMRKFLNIYIIQPTPTITPTSTITPTETPTYTITATVTDTVTPIDTATETVTDTITQTITPTQTPTQTLTETPTITDTETATPIVSPSSTLTPTPTATASETASPSGTSTVTETVTEIVTETATVTPTKTITETNTPTATETSTETMTNTPTATETATVTPTKTITETNTPTATETVTKTGTNTSTMTVTQTATYTITFTNTHTLTITSTITKTLTATKTQTITLTASPTHTPTATKTSTMTTTCTKTTTFTKTPTKTFTKTKTPTKTSTSTITPTRTMTPVPVIIILEFKAGDVYRYSASPHPQFRIKNKGAGSINIAKLEIRYWYKYDGVVKPEESYIDWAGVNGNPITDKVYTGIINGSFGTQDRYLKITFKPDAGTLGNGINDYLEVNTRFNKQDWSQYDQANDWSFVNYTSFTQWDKVTVYYDGVLVYGEGPGMAPSYISKTQEAEEIAAANVFCYPNPAKEKLIIRFSMNRQEPVKIEIKDMKGGIIWQKEIAGDEVRKGINNVEWDLIDNRGNKVSNGVYIYKIIADDKIIIKKLTVVR